MAAAASGGGTWRAMAAGDLAEVLKLAAVIHPDYPEDAAVFAERLGLYPQGCMVLETPAAAGDDPGGDAGGRLGGYLVSHPWTAGAPPALDSLLGALPPFPALYYLHDLALLPVARGTGAARAAVARAAAVAAQAGLDCLGLVAVNGAAAFWRRCGFASSPDAALQAAARKYDATASYMTRAVAAPEHAVARGQK
ncbi:N-acetyltransferase GCN5 [Camelimonas fluminis]|uniref:GNAT family N-acetyltransferase n=1 Tax=Camelimonas fluminis TaxID=1576911 RepID=A0ABV7UFF6_9HYPH|nr:GNAT family N-acetyltransferase [Camelimonas fluminis]GHE67249.1 N-acetyltransferase GCN5 [Camelimonas fluminis]